MNASNAFPLERSERIEIVTKATITKYPLGDIDNLRGKQILAIEAYKVSDVSVAPLGNPLVNDTIFKKSFLTLSLKSDQAINSLPLVALNTSSNNGLLKRFNNIVIDFNNSFIQLPNDTGLVADEAFFLMVYYKNPGC